MEKKPPAMMTMLLAWMSFWVAMSVNEQIGPFVALGVGTSFVNMVVLLNNIMPAMMAVFTVWFQRWYPIWVARGKNYMKGD